MQKRRPTKGPHLHCNCEIRIQRCTCSLIALQYRLPAPLMCRFGTCNYSAVLEGLLDAHVVLCAREFSARLGKSACATAADVPQVWAIGTKKRFYRPRIALFPRLTALGENALSRSQRCRPSFAIQAEEPTLRKARGAGSPRAIGPIGRERDRFHCATRADSLRSTRSTGAITG